MYDGANNNIYLLYIWAIYCLSDAVESEKCTLKEKNAMKHAGSTRDAHAAFEPPHDPCLTAPYDCCV